MNNNLTLFADATINGGIYEKVKVFGQANVLSDINASEMRVFGSCTFNGKCQINYVKLLGESEFCDYVDVNELNVKGACNFKEDVKVVRLKIYGATKFLKKVYRSEELQFFGSVDANVLEADNIYIKGSINCSEQLNGEKITIILHNCSQIKEIVGTHIEIKPGFKIFLRKKHNAVIDTIEGDEIYLENVITKTVRGNNITVGPNCKIDLIEYRDICNLFDKKDVKEIERY